MKKKENTAVIVPVVIMFSCFTTYHYAVIPLRCGDKGKLVAFSGEGVGSTLQEALADAKKKCHLEMMSACGNSVEVLGFFSSVTVSGGGTFNTFGGKE